MMMHALALTALLALTATQPGVGIAVTPGKVDLSVQPGAVSTFPVLVRNDHDRPVHVQVTPADFRMTENGEYVYESPGAHAASLAHWLAVRPREFDIPANSFQQVAVTLAVPAAKLDGEYSGVLLIATRPEREHAAVVYSARYALKVYGDLSGSIKHGGEITAMHAVATSDGEQYRVTFRNSGNAHVYVNGHLDVLRGNVRVASFALPRSQVLERASERTFEFDGSNLPHGTYDAVAVFDIGGAEKIGGRVRFDA